MKDNTKTNYKGGDLGGLPIPPTSPESYSFRRALEYKLKRFVSTHKKIYKVKDAPKKKRTTIQLFTIQREKEEPDILEALEEIEKAAQL